MWWTLSIINVHTFRSSHDPRSIHICSSQYSHPTLQPNHYLLPWPLRRNNVLPWSNAWNEEGVWKERMWLNRWGHHTPFPILLSILQVGVTLNRTALHRHTSDTVLCSASMACSNCCSPNSVFILSVVRDGGVARWPSKQSRTDKHPSSLN